MNNIKENNFFIPRKIAVGFVKRANTYSGKLSYITYYDNTNKLRKDVSWNGWRDKNIEPVYTDNIPTSGFIINKRAGGEKWGWNQRATYARIYDPRGFEFEITIDNLLWILEYTNSENKELKGQFVYSWYGTELVLMPIVSSDYEESKRLSEQQYNKTSFKERDLIPGTLYKMKGKELNELVYIGKVKVSTEFNMSYVNKLAFVPIQDSWKLYSHYDKNINRSDFFIFKSVSSVIAEMQQNYFSDDIVKEYLHRFDMCAYSYNFWNNFGNFIDKFVSDHPCIMNDYKKPYKIEYNRYSTEKNNYNNIIDKFEYNGIKLDSLRIIPEWLIQTDREHIFYENTSVLKSVISDDGKSVLIKDQYPTIEKINTFNRIVYKRMYDFMNIDLNTNTFNKICDPGLWDEYRGHHSCEVSNIIYKHPSETTDVQKAREINTQVSLNDNRTFLYYITKDNYISISLQEMIRNHRYMKFGFSNGIDENKWVTLDVILLPKKIK